MNQSLRQPIPFPHVSPDGYRYMDEPVEFDSQVHLALEFPEHTLRLKDLGYSKQQISASPTDFAISSAARLLSDQGVKALTNVCRSLRQHAVSCERIENLVRGGVYRSRFLRDLCLCPQVTEFVSDIFGIAVAPHSMPMQLGHLNFSPSDLSKVVDKWHHDTLELDYVLSVSDPRNLSGGEFQYFFGTKFEAEELARQGRAIPQDKVVSPEFPGAGYMIIMHGNMVVHRAAKLSKAGERITMVNGYVPLDINAIDTSRFRDLKAVDPNEILYSEWARHKAWLAQGKLNHLIQEMTFTEDHKLLISLLKKAIFDVETAIEELADESTVSMVNYGD